MLIVIRVLEPYSSVEFLPDDSPTTAVNNIRDDWVMTSVVVDSLTSPLLIMSTAVVSKHQEEISQDHDSITRKIISIIA